MGEIACEYEQEREEMRSCPPHAVGRKEKAGDSGRKVGCFLAKQVDSCRKVHRFFRTDRAKRIAVGWWCVQRAE